MAFGAFPARGRGGRVSLLPTGALIFNVRDEQAADVYVLQQVAPGGNWRYSQSEDLRQWTREQGRVGWSIQRLPGYLIITSEQGAERITNSLQMDGRSVLADVREFQVARSRVGAAPLFWLWDGTFGGGLALEVQAEGLSLEAFLDAEGTLLPDAAPLEQSAVEGVPTGALFVDSGVDFNLTAQAGLDALNESLFGGLLNLEDGFESLLGIDLQEDTLPLLEGTYALYAGYGRGDLYDLFGAPLEAGLLLAPADQALLTATVLTVLAALEALGLEVESLGSSLAAPRFRVEALEDILLPLGLGSLEGRFYLSTDSGAERSTRAISGRNLSTDRNWERIWAGRPAGTEHITYVNLKGITALLEEFIATGEEEIPLLEDVLAYLARFESLALYNQVDALGYLRVQLSLRLVAAE
ncbi:MAG: hypothetical protein HC915_02325 [Anaerolineae bacterium]|nr:hypothetical protein [Anaerolineae bacterium]